jgi:YHS domain-containing protein
MKSTLLLAGAALTISAVAFAAPGDKGKAKAAPKEVACAVMPDHKVNIAEATKTKMFSDYKGKRYFFCCAGCPSAFKKDPAKFAKAESIPTPTTAKKKG